MNEPAAVFSSNEGAGASSAAGGKVLTFTLADEDYGVSIHKVREIIGMMPITRVPRTEDFVRGVINLRGRVIPVIDLRLRFGMPEVKQSEKTCIIIVEVVSKNAVVQTGIVVDTVSEVLNIAAEDVEASPDLGAGGRTRYIQGMAKLEGRVKILIDIDMALGDHGLARLERMANL